MKPIKKEEAQKALVTMLWKEDPISRDQIFNSIDRFLIEELGIKKEDIPWLNKKKDNQKGYLDLLFLFRLTYARIFSEYSNKHYTKLN